MARSAAHLLFFYDFVTTAAALGAAAEQAPSGTFGWELEIGEQQPAHGFLFGSSQSLTSVPDHCCPQMAAGMEEKTNATSETI